jgi:hypothetical protein
VSRFDVEKTRSRYGRNEGRPVDAPDLAGETARRAYPNLVSIQSSVSTCRPVVTVARGGVDSAAQTVLLPVRPGREEKAVGRLSRRTVSETQAPQAVDFQYLVIYCTQLSEASARGWIERINGTVTEVSDEQPLAESPEVRGRKRESPRCVQTPTRAYPADQIAIAVEHVDLKWVMPFADIDGR